MLTRARIYLKIVPNKNISNILDKSPCTLKQAATFDAPFFLPLHHFAAMPPLFFSVPSPPPGHCFVASASSHSLELGRLLQRALAAGAVEIRNRYKPGSFSLPAWCGCLQLEPFEGGEEKKEQRERKEEEKVVAWQQSGGLEGEEERSKGKRRKKESGGLEGKEKWRGSKRMGVKRKGGSL